jgi:3-oxoacyl-[acyl-carrier protein] reductase
MVRARWGRIVNVSSVVGLVGNAGQANYAASKAGIIGFTKSVAREVAQRGITANVVAPGYVETELTGSLPTRSRNRSGRRFRRAVLGSLERWPRWSLSWSVRVRGTLRDRPWPSMAV